jgi:hypothetical protein
MSFTYDFFRFVACPLLEKHLSPLQRRRQDFLHGTSWVCPEVNDRTPGGAQAHGYCTVTDEDGDKAFVIWQCKGQPRCDGDFQWTGGTGKYMGLKGATSFTGVPIGSTASGYSRFTGNWQVP